VESDEEPETSESIPALDVSMGVSAPDRKKRVSAGVAWRRDRDRQNVTALDEGRPDIVCEVATDIGYASKPATQSEVRSRE